MEQPTSSRLCRAFLLVGLIPTGAYFICIQCALRQQGCITMCYNGIHGKRVPRALPLARVVKAFGLETRGLKHHVSSSPKFLPVFNAGNQGLDGARPSEKNGFACCSPSAAERYSGLASTIASWKSRGVISDLSI